MRSLPVVLFAILVSPSARAWCTDVDRTAECTFDGLDLCAEDPTTHTMICDFGHARGGVTVTAVTAESSVVQCDSAVGDVCIWGYDGLGEEFCCELAAGPIELWGTDDADILHLRDEGSGTQLADAAWVYGEEGDDHLMASFDNPSPQRLYGGAGADTLTAPSTGGYLYGEDGADTLHGGGNGLLDGGADDDVLYGEDGDQLWGQAGADDLYALEGGTTMYGGDGTDLLSGSDEAENLYGGAHNDLICGYGGPDWLFGGPGSDTLDGGDDPPFFGEIDHFDGGGALYQTDYCEVATATGCEAGLASAPVSCP